MALTTQRPLLARVARPENLRAAWRHVQAKRAHGRSEPQPLTLISTPKPPGSKDSRTLRLPSVRDKVTQEAVCSVIEPMRDRQFLDRSYGYRPGKGPARAVGRVSHELVQRKLAWVVTADIDDFFGTVSHDRLRDRLRGCIRDGALLRLLLLPELSAVHRPILTNAEGGALTVLAPRRSKCHTVPARA